MPNMRHRISSFMSPNHSWVYVPFQRIFIMTRELYLGSLRIIYLEVEPIIMRLQEFENIENTSRAKNKSCGPQCQGAVGKVRVNQVKLYRLKDVNISLFFQTSCCSCLLLWNLFLDLIFHFFTIVFG